MTTTDGATAAPVNDTIRCYNCSQFGHYQTQCPKPKRPVGSCFKCGTMGHLHQACPKRGLVAAVEDPPKGSVRMMYIGDEEGMVEAIHELQMSEEFH
ncbi:zinc finger protein GIS2-like [Rhagoletis pomonella]|uniref:zinc finger protein GIS2-like n=1 Tax=Rhagoletis pomonella TaxID=28610 RepID=UPI00178008A3|nr:zinc finger protein GIS2-like [Rhagoletis pomonella]